MDDRLIPLNGLIALLRGEGGWPGLLGAQGFRRHQLEVPVSTPLGDLRADALIYRRQPDLILLCECKSGRNLEEQQARRYAAAVIESLRRPGSIPPELVKSRSVVVRPLFVGREERRADLEHGLRSLGVDAPLLTVGAERVRLQGASGIPGLDDFDERHTWGFPPARIPVDHQSGDEPLRELLIPQLTAAQAREQDIVAVESVANAILPEWAVLSHGARQAFVRRLETLITGHLLAASSAASFGMSARRAPAIAAGSCSNRRRRPETRAAGRRRGRLSRSVPGAR